MARIVACWLTWTAAAWATGANAQTLRTHEQILAALPEAHRAVESGLAELAARYAGLPAKPAGSQQAVAALARQQHALSTLVAKWGELAPENGDWERRLGEAALAARLAEVEESFQELLGTVRSLAAIDARRMIQIQAAARDVARLAETFDALVDEWDGVGGNQRHTFLPAKPAAGPAAAARAADPPKSAAAKAPQPGAADAGKATAAPAGPAAKPVEAPAPAVKSAAVQIPDDERVDLDEADRLEEEWAARAGTADEGTGAASK